MALDSSVIGWGMLFDGLFLADGVVEQQSHSQQREA